jgi:hypothetical protein
MRRLLFFWCWPLTVFNVLFQVTVVSCLLWTWNAGVYFLMKMLAPCVRTLANSR